MLRKYVAGAMGAFLWQLTPAWGHPHHSVDQPIVNSEGHGFHEVGHWEIDNSFVHLDAKVFEHAKELHDQHIEEWQADHAEEQLSKSDSYKVITRASCAVGTEFPLVNMEGRSDDDCKCAACVIKGSKFIMSMIVRGVEKKCSTEEVKMLSETHGDSGEVSSWNFDELSKKDGEKKDDHHHHWNPERMRKWFCSAYKGHPEVVLGFLAYHVRPMQSAGAWCMGAGYCKKHHDLKAMTLEHASQSQKSEKVIDMNERHHWMHMDVLPQFLNAGTKSFMSVGHDGALEEDHFASMNDWEREKAGWWSEKREDAEESAKQQLAEDAGGLASGDKKKEIDATTENDINIKKKEEQAKLEEMEQAETQQIVSARMLGEQDLVQPHRTWLGSMLGEHGHGQHMVYKDGGMRCDRMKRCMRMAMGWAMKWAIKKTYEMCQRCTDKRVQMMCKWAGHHKHFALGMLIAHVAPWKFALGRCLHKHEDHGHGPHHRHQQHHKLIHGGPFAPLLSWLPFVEQKPEDHARRMKMEQPRMGFSFPLMRHTRAMMGRLVGERLSVSPPPDASENISTVRTEQDPSAKEVTRKTTMSVNGEGTIKTTEVKGNGFRVTSSVFRSRGA